MKTYRKLIKPVVIQPDAYYNPVKNNLESPEVWYDEDEQESVASKMNGIHHFDQWNILSFDEKFVPID